MTSHLVVATCAGLFVSSVALFSVLVVLPSLYNEITDLHTDLLIEMGHFKIKSNDLWSTMMSMQRSGGGSPSFGIPNPFLHLVNNPSRGKRASAYLASGASHSTQPATQPLCSCNPQNNCPAGPPGPPGLPGDSGIDGHPGESGLPGFDPFSMLPLLPEAPKACRICPVPRPGPAGEPGLPGPPGAQGPTGPPGPPPIPGRRGPEGSIGDVGNTGRPGALGLIGPPGDHLLVGDGPLGEPGVTGQQGTRGEPGNPGNDAPLFVPGLPGDRGDNGRDGYQGSPGPDGFPGDQGPPGEDGKYCSCPDRSPSSQPIQGFPSQGQYNNDRQQQPPPPPPPQHNQYPASSAPVRSWSEWNNIPHPNTYTQAAPFDPLNDDDDFYVNGRQRVAFGKRGDVDYDLLFQAQQRQRQTNKKQKS